MKHIELTPKRLLAKDSPSINETTYTQGFKINPIWNRIDGYYKNQFSGFEIKQNKRWFPLKFFINRKHAAFLADFDATELVNMSTTDEMLKMAVFGQESVYEPNTPANILYRVVSFKNRETLKALD